MAMKLFRGRLFDHVHLRVANLEKSKRFYKAVLAPLGFEVSGESEQHIFFDELWIDAADAAGPSHVHLAFQAKDEETVRRFHAAGLAAGGKDNGPPGPRDYHPGYFAAFVLDPDGHNLEAVWHGPAPFKRNADAVEITIG
jgi:catechol 2,3-dioxygenase-like lactoylglutathione lyase family enzyme